jgi:polyhydroxybutyrate depolymerase
MQMKIRCTVGLVFRVIAVGLVPLWIAACSSSEQRSGPPAEPDSPGAAGTSSDVTPGGQEPGASQADGAGGTDAAAGSGADTMMQPSDLSGGEGGPVAGAGGAPGSDDDDQTAAPACSAAAAMLAPGDTTRTLAIDGVQRSFLVHLPPAYDGSTRLPVVFDFHGLGGNSNQQKNLSRWDDVGDEQGFITVYPQGVENAWNAGLCCNNNATDDVAFVREIIAALASDTCVDTRRIFASGCSNGGGMSYKLACEAADVIAGIAPVDFDCVDGPGCGNCEPERPITVVQFRGTNDQLVDYEGNGPFAGAQANLATWSEINECTGAAEPLQENNACEAPPTCSGGAQTILCTVQNGTHCGSYGYFKIAQVAWRVLEGEALP